MMWADFARDVQAFMTSLAPDGVGVYDTAAPRDKSGTVSVEPPFVVYTVAPLSQEGEAPVWRCAVRFDIWATDTWADCYEIAEAVDAGMDRTVHTLDHGGMVACDRDGVCFQRMPRDPDDESIRRMAGQYLIRFYPSKD